MGVQKAQKVLDEAIKQIDQGAQPVMHSLMVALKEMMKTIEHIESDVLEIKKKVGSKS